MLTATKEYLALLFVFLLFPSSLVILWFMSRNTYLFPIVCMLWIWAIFIDKAPFNGQGRSLTTFRRLSVWKIIRGYFPAGLVQTAPLSPTQSYLFAIHPHGIFCAGAWLNFVTDATDFSKNNANLDVAPATVSVNFFLPIWRDIILALGFIDASQSSLKAALARGRSIMIAVGGAAESLDCHPGTYDLTLKKRKGFVKLALSMGVQIVPVFTFGETSIYSQVANPRGSFLRSIQEYGLSIFKFALPLLTTRLGMIPNRSKVAVIVGSPIDIPKIENPSAEVVEEYHTKYVDELFKLFNKHRKQYGEGHSELKLVQ